MARRLQGFLQELLLAVVQVDLQGLPLATPMDDGNPIRDWGFFIWKVSHPSPNMTHEVSIPQLLNVLFLGFLEVFNCGGLIAFGGCGTCFRDNQLLLKSSHHDRCVFGLADLLPQLRLLLAIKIVKGEEVGRHVEHSGVILVLSTSFQGLHPG
jgi:hypothetical protein